MIGAPVVEGKLDAWKAWTQELMGPLKAALADFNKRYGRIRHAGWLADTPMGTFVVALH